jgi:proteic killer suppression protein
MIKKFRHKRLARFFSTGSVSGIQPTHAKRLKLILGRLNASTNPKDMDLPGLRLHELKGRDKGRWSVWVNGNWRVTFRFEGVDATDVDYEDYH